ncbi:hypothetical protein QBC39DRAFT_340604, partial [Podospora conica]
MVAREAWCIEVLILLYIYSFYITRGTAALPIWMGWACVVVAFRLFFFVWGGNTTGRLGGLETRM